MPFVRVATLDELWRGDMKGYIVQGRKVLLVRMEDAVHAYEDRCAHQGVMLSLGSFDGRVLTCSAHAWQYDACTGGGVNPVSTQLTRFPLKVEDGEILIDIGEG